jgi:hypothetical protein
MADDKTTPELVQDAVQRLITYTDEMTYFGENSANLAIARMNAEQTSMAYQLRRGLLRRYTILASGGEDLDKVIEEQGGRRRRGKQRGRTLVVIRPQTATVVDIVANDVEISDADAANFDVADSVRIRSEDGSVTESATITAKGSAGAGPNGGTVLTLSGLVNAYAPTTEDVKLLLRHTILAGTELTSTSGINYQFVDDVTIGDANPVLDGESAALSLADKQWAEAVQRGAAGSIDANGITGLAVPDAKVAAVFNPERSAGAADQETDFAAKRRTSNAGQLGAQLSPAWFEALAQRGNRQVLRLFPEDSSSVSTIRGRVVARNGGGLSADERAALARYIEQRSRATLSVEIENAVLTAVEITATITLDPGTGSARSRLRAAWLAAADRFADYLDWRKWPDGQAVDEAALLALLVGTNGVATVVTSTFTPAADIEVAETSIPSFTRLSLTDSTSGLTLQADLSQEF